MSPKFLYAPPIAKRVPSPQFAISLSLTSFQIQILLRNSIGGLMEYIREYWGIKDALGTGKWRTLQPEDVFYIFGN